MTALRVAVFGLGPMGRRHAAVVAEHPDCSLVAAVDPDPSASQWARARGLSPVEPEDLDLAVIATPPHTHAEVAAPLLRRGVACLIEKPLDSDLVAASRLSTDPRVACGLVERFNPAVVEAGWTSCFGSGEPFVAHACRETTREDGPHVALDLMIHDLDLLLWGAGADAVEVLDVSGDARTFGATIRIGPMIAHLLARRGATNPVRVIELPGVHLDLQAKVVTRGATRVEARGDALRAQWGAFVSAVKRGAPFEVAGYDGLRALRAARLLIASTPG